METIFKIDSIDDYNHAMGLETRHPLVTVINEGDVKQFPFSGEVTFQYGVYALFLKQTYCGDITYGRMPYDYQEGTVTSFAPGQVVKVKFRPDFKPKSQGLLFHPDLIRGTSLGQDAGPAVPSRPHTRHVARAGYEAILVLRLLLARGPTPV